MAIEQLTEAQREFALAALPAWSLSSDGLAIERTFRFADFSEAFGFIGRVALLAEKLDHHPEWSNSWSRVSIILTTHDAGGLSTRDTAMAAAIDALA